MRSLLLVMLFALPAIAAPKVTSKTTDLYPSKKCKEKSKGGEGQDPVLTCPAAVKGYDVTVSFSAEATQVTVSGDGKDTGFYGHLGKTLEWRLRDGKPFALIVETGDTDPDKIGKVINRRIAVYAIGADKPKAELPLGGKVSTTKQWAAARIAADKD
jgi:hypothetical protein